MKAQPTTASPTTPGVRPRTWLITGASRGLGREFARAALSRGDNVVAVSRSIESADLPRDPERLLRLPADVTDRTAVFAAFDTAREHFGGLDIVVDNAGTMAYGFVEEFTEEQARAQFETNFFGAMWVSQAAMAAFRSRGRGHLVQISSIGGVLSGPGTGLYSASKFALEGLSEALALEAAHFGIDVTIVEPGGYWTDLYTTMTVSAPRSDYDSLRAEIEKQSASTSIDSHPALAARALLEVVDADRPPRRIVLGSAVLDAAVAATREKIATWLEWESVSRAAEDAVPAPESSGGARSAI
ncbi:MULTISPECIES: SDR family NAD(P)-dependent oxidoreductase [Rhodococcus]|uniref:SDR family NAD(P)-dependent oxidoreductase n=1 Tax=Rhodococcus TaxID=1827 RepID=UPI00051A0D19|nr:MULTISPECIES: SDR family NAD(P)-dependent oxidoreductase [Rhodococcus]QXU56110.1 SDR family NAD(P)-dependent oxidoreductase [Rhodococcus sp. LW-XY12]AOD24530.1 short-chain dehydrogenase [Rhodococcus sp. p52]KHJ72807.1 short-chain dehydrogenase [Rhodococcus sp. Chr-9]OBA35061.1 short-chain dehydrogenase [Rhodococcus sp. 852002-51564_SCH6189132-a]QQM51574.1 SDR family NAD(P)-dependent oxidoreductase [Rhodococcus pyridinivorans]